MLQFTHLRNWIQTHSWGLRVGALFALAWVQGLAYLGLQAGQLGAAADGSVGAWTVVACCSWLGVAAVVLSWRRTSQPALSPQPAGRDPVVDAPQFVNSRPLRLHNSRPDMWVAWAPRREPELEMAEAANGVSPVRRFVEDAEAAHAAHLLRRGAGARTGRCSWISPRPR